MRRPDAEWQRASVPADVDASEPDRHRVEHEKVVTGPGVQPGGEVHWIGVAGAIDDQRRRDIRGRLTRRPTRRAREMPSSPTSAMTTAVVGIQAEISRASTR